MDKDSSPSGRAKKKSIRWSWLIIAIVALIIIGGAIAYFDSHANKSSTSSNASSKKPFAAAASAKDPVLITINTRAQGDKTGSIAGLQSDGKGNFRYTLFANGKAFNTSVFTPDAYYTCNDPASPCLKYPRDKSASAFDPSGYLYTSDKIIKVKEHAVYQGQQKCPIGGGTCDVWSYGNKIDKKNFYVNTASKKIVAVIDTGHFGPTQIVTHIAYEFSPQQVTAPTNYKIAPAESGTSPDMSQH